jgi:Tfp pilus assembly protein PilO
MKIEAKLTRKQLSTALQDFYQKPVAKVSLELFLSIGAVLFFAIFAVRPTLLTMAELVKEIEDKQKLDQQLQQKIAALSTAQSTYLSLQDRLIALDQAIPNTPQFIRSLKLLEKVASEQQLIISNLTVNEIPQEEAADQSKDLQRVTIPVSVTVTGEYASIKGFIEQVLNLRRTYIIDTVVFSKNDERGQERLDAIITFGMPYFGEEK